MDNIYCQSKTLNKIEAFDEVVDGRGQSVVRDTMEFQYRVESYLRTFYLNLKPS